VNSPKWKIDAARRDHGHGHAVGDGAREREVEAVARAVAVHAREQELARARGRHARAPREGVEARGTTAAVREDLPSGRVGRRRRIAARVDGDDDGLVAEGVGGAAHELGLGHGRRVDAHLVGAREQELSHVVDGAHAAAHGERQEHALGRRAHDVERRRAPLGRRRDVEVADLVGALRVVSGRDGDGIARVAQLLEAHALLDAPVGDVEAGNDTFAEHAGAR
jgi:hypothetical protein